MLVCRTEHELSQELREKLALFCNVKPEAVIQSIDATTIYEVPILMQNEGLDAVVLSKLKLEQAPTPNLKEWNFFLNRYKNPKATVKIGLVGKYVELQDSYKSILESFIHAGAANEVEVSVKSIHSEHISEKNLETTFGDLNALLVAPGFGERGIEGKILAVKYARENKIPFLGICLGMQMAVIEFARNVLGLKEASSVEMDAQTAHPVIDLMEDQKHITNMGGTMRLGAWLCCLEPNTLVAGIYKNEAKDNCIHERHRHRYEFNNKYKDQLIANGMQISGINPETQLAEIIELKDHPWFVGVQYHPEYKSTVVKPHPLFVAFVAAAYTHQKQ